MEVMGLKNVKIEALNSQSSSKNESQGSRDQKESQSHDSQSVNSSEVQFKKELVGNNK